MKIPLTWSGDNFSDWEGGEKKFPVRSFSPNQNNLSKENKMKKSILLSLIMGIAWIVGSWAMAAPFPTLPAPTGLTCSTDGDSVSFDWDDVTGATKYSVDVAVLISGTWEEGVIVNLSFGTGDRTDGGLMGDSNLDVLFTEFLYDLNLDGTLDPVYGEARAKVKALNPPGKGFKSQNNPFSDECSFTVPSPTLQ